MSRFTSLTVLTLILLLVLLFKSGEAATYYVASSGCSNNYPGTKEQPWCTPQKATTTVSCGDTVYIKAGTYPEFKFTNKSCTNTTWITFRNYGTDVVTIDPYQDNYALEHHGITFVRSSYIEINGLKVTDSNTDLNSTNFAVYSQYNSYDGIKIQGESSPDSSHIRIQNCTIYHVGQVGISWQNVAGGYGEFLNNRIYDIARSHRGYGMYLKGNHHTIRGNTIYNCYGYGVHLYADEGGVTYHLVEKNRFYNNGHGDYGAGYSGFPINGETRGYGIIIAGGGGNHTVRNNLIYGNYQGGIKVANSNNNIYNNTVYNNGNGTGYGIRVDEDQSNTVRNNILYANIGGKNIYIGSRSTADHNLTSDPKFVDGANGKFYLLSNSPAIDTGATVPVTDDYEGNARPYNGAYDIGAYEYGSAQPPPEDTIPPAPPADIEVK